MVKIVQIAGHPFYQAEKKKDLPQAACFAASNNDAFFVALQTSPRNYIYASFLDHVVFYDWMRLKHAVYRHPKAYGEKRCFYQLNRSIETSQTSSLYADVEWYSDGVDPTADHRLALVKGAINEHVPGEFVAENLT